MSVPLAGRQLPLVGLVGGLEPGRPIFLDEGPIGVAVGGPRPAAVATETSPGTPEEQGDDEAYGADDHENYADGVDVEVGGMNRGGEPQYGAYGEHDDTRANTHFLFSLLR
jgi:hypothetical protein